MRREEVYRKTKETEVKVQVNLDGEGKAAVNTAVPFLDHMLTSLATHSLIDISASVKGVSTQRGLKCSVTMLTARLMGSW